MFQTNKKNNLISNDNLNVIASIIFIVFFFCGILIAPDYGLSTDEPFQRAIGYYWYINLIEKFFSEYSSIEILKAKFDNMYWSNEIKEGQFLFYSAFFDTLCAFIEELTQINNSKHAFILKHKLTFTVFFISSIFFWKIIKNRFPNKNFLLFVLIFYLTTPRIFAESFYNSKDIVFMSFCVFSIYYYFKYLDNNNLSNIILFTLFAALATTIRIMGIQFFLMFSLFFLLNSLEEKNYFKTNYKKYILHILLYFFFIFLFWPFLWNNPLQNFIISFKSFANYPWENYIFYLGNYIKANNLPWHYIPLWIFISTPLFQFFLFLVGFSVTLKLFLVNFISLDEKKKLWKHVDQQKDFFILIFFLFPIFTIIVFNSTLYGGWRHLYYIYPCIIYFISVFLNSLYKINSFFKQKNIISLLILTLLISNVYALIKFHPYQNVYFNVLIKKNANKFFEIDYWGLGNLQTIKLISNDKENLNKSIRTASFAPLEYTQLMLDEERLKFEGTTQNDQDFIFTNYTFENNPYFLKKYDIPKNYNKYFSLKRDGIIINEIFKKK